MAKVESQKDRKWRLLNTGSGSAQFNMALDEAIFICMKKGIVPPTLRFYGWNTPAVSIGYFQPVDKVRKIFGTKFDFVRRMTGGGAVYHFPDTAYSLVVDCSQGRGVREFSERISHAIISGLRGLDVNSKIYLKDGSGSSLHASSNGAGLCFSRPQCGDVVVNGRKLAGGAQRRRAGTVFYQGSILIEKPDVFADLFRGSISLKELVNGRSEMPQVLGMLRSGFARQFRVSIEGGNLHPEEIGLANELMKKYRSSSWNARY